MDTNIRYNNMNTNNRNNKSTSKIYLNIIIYTVLFRIKMASTTAHFKNNKYFNTSDSFSFIFVFELIILTF